MPLDTRIALGVQPLQMPQQESPLNRYAQMMQIEAGDQARQMNMLKMQEAQEVMRERNALRGLQRSDPDYLNKLYAVSPTQGIAFEKAQREGASAKITDLKNQSEILKNRDVIERQMHQVLSANPTNEAMIATNHVMQTSPFYSPEEKKAFADRLESVFAMPIPERAALFARMGQAPGTAAAGPMSPEAMAQQLELRAASRQPVAPREDPRMTVGSTQVDAAGNVTHYNKFGEPLGAPKLGAGKPSATYEKGVQQKKQLGLDLDSTISELEKATAKGGLIERSTGSGAGALYDMAAGFVGSASEGAVAIGALQPIYDKVLKMVPRFEGPQSDKDTASYQAAAGNLANPATPKPIKLEAAKTILRLMRERKSQFGSKDLPEEAAIPKAPAGGGWGKAVAE